MTEEVSNQHEPASESRELMRRIWRGLAVAVIFALFLTANVLTPAFLEEPSGLVLFGVTVAQLTLICVWGTLVSGTFWVRLPWTFLLLTISWAALSYGVYLNEERLSSATAIGLGVVWFFGFATSYIPLKLAALWFRWRITRQGAKKRNDGRFAIRDLMIGTGILAATLAVGQRVLPERQLPSIPEIIEACRLDAELLILLSVFGVFSLIVKLPSIRIALATPKPKLLQYAGVWLLISGFMGVLEFVILVGLLGPPGPPEEEFLIYFVLCHLVMASVIMGVLFLLRAFGYRLERTSKVGVGATK